MIKQESIFAGIDGEGQGRLNHLYTMLAVVDEHGRSPRCIENPNGLSTADCLEFILSTPSNYKLFSYAFQYDLTKILTDVNDAALYKLMRPELRVRKDPKKSALPPKAVMWGHFRLNLQATKFTVSRGNRKKVIWDIFRFYGSKFVQALKDWKVGTPERLSQMTKMKDARAEFDKHDQREIRAYCFDECQYMGQLARKLVDAHENVGLKLTGFYGAGSSASAMLKKMGILKKIRPTPPQLQEAVASAFFGGRFENSVLGSIKEPCYNYDISSSYPYQCCFLPCLEHGYWYKTYNFARMLAGRTALVRYYLPAPKTERTWGPFPFRERSGSICFPRSSGGGWIWKEEFLAGRRLFDNALFVEAWVYECDCNCKPFADIPGYYLERIRIGKEGPGIVIKLGCNSCYGKLAQSVGRAPFNSWIWAGLITSGTRAQMLDVMALHKDLSNLLMIATDGIYTKERLTDDAHVGYIPRAIPRDTGTFTMPDGRPNAKPLGGWEEKACPSGVFVARPGVYFPLNPTPQDIKEVRARGVGKSVVLEHWKEIIKQYEELGVYGRSDVCTVNRFAGIKSSISRVQVGESYLYNRAPRYGQWVERQIQMSFDPLPKRKCLADDGVSLVLRDMTRVRSRPYSRANRSREGLELEQVSMEILEQPDCDYVDYERIEA